MTNKPVATFFIAQLAGVATLLGYITTILAFFSCLFGAVIAYFGMVSAYRKYKDYNRKKIKPIHK